MSVSNNIHNIAVLDAAEMIQEYTAEEKVPILPSPPKGKEDQQKFEKKKVQKKTSTMLQFKNSSYALAPKTRQQYHELENRIAADDQNILDLKEMKNSLESYGYDMRQKIDEYGELK